MLPSLSKHFVKALKSTVKRRGPTEQELSKALDNLRGEARRAEAATQHVIQPTHVWDRRYSPELARAVQE